MRPRAAAVHKSQNQMSRTSSRSLIVSAREKRPSGSRSLKWRLANASFMITTEVVLDLRPRCDGLQFACM